MIKNLKQYRMMDLGLLTVLAIISEVLGDLLHKQLPGAGFHLSFSILIALIAIVRWGKAGTLVYIIAGIPMIILGPNSMIQNILLYPAANGFILLCALIAERFDMKEMIRDNLRLLLFTATAFVATAIGKGLMLFLYGDSIFSASAMYFLANMFSLIMTYVVLLIVRRKGDLLVDMETYFIDSQTEERQ